MPTETNTLGNTFGAFTAGVDAVPGTGPQKRIVVKSTGTWAAGDRIELMTLYNETQYDLGVKEVTQAVITYATAFRNQVMFCAGDRLYFSGIDAPTGFENRYAGYGFITVSGERGEALECLAAAPYAGKLAVFAENNIQLWAPNADPTAWQLIQTLENTGTCSPKTVVSYGELDVFYLSNSGLRSLRSREFVDLVNVQDVGSPIDILLQALLRNMSVTTKRNLVHGFYSSIDGRYWLMLGAVTYVFSYFVGEKVAAWTQYEQEYWNYITSTKQDFFPLWTASRNGTLYIMDPGASGSGDARTLGVYPAGATLNELYEEASAPLRAQMQAGTITLLEYSAQINALSVQYSAGHHSDVQIIVPFFDAKAPASMKHFHSIDIYGSGTWKVYVNDSPSTPNTYVTVVEALLLSTSEYARIPLGLHSSHIKLKLESTVNESAAIGSVIWHWTDEGSR